MNTCGVGDGLSGDMLGSSWCNLVVNFLILCVTISDMWLYERPWKMSTEWFPSSPKHSLVTVSLRLPL